MAIKNKSAPGLSDYELARQEKIAKNQALLQQLQLDALQTGIGPKSKKKPAKTNDVAKRKRASTERVKKEDDGPRRTSARLQGIIADSEVARQKEEKDAEVFAEQQRIKRQRVSGDISLGDAVLSGNYEVRGNWLRNIAQPGERTFSDQDVSETTDKQLKELRERMSSLQLWEGAEPSRIKITPERIYSLGFHPTTDKALVFAGDKLGNLGIFDASQTSPAEVKREAEEEDTNEVGDEIEPAISTFKIHTRTISAFQFAPNNDNHLFSASYDSSVRKLDLLAGQAIEVYGPSESDADEPVSGVEISRTDPNLLHFTTLNGAFGMKDLRTPPHETIELMRLSEKKIGGFTLHPTHPHLVATASLDRKLCLWDLRKITGRRDRMPALVAEHESKLSVSHAAFNAAGQVATASYDDTIKIFNAADLANTKAPPAEPVDDFQPTTVIPHNNQTGRWVTILRAQWQMQPQDGVQRFVIGNMNRFVDIYSSTGQQLAQLGGEGITAVPAVAKFHERMDWVAAGTASGKLCLWM